MQATPVNFGANNAYAVSQALRGGLPAGAWSTFAGNGTHAFRPHFGQQQNTQAAKPHTGYTKSWMA